MSDDAATDRRAAIVEAYRREQSSVKVAAEFGISRQRVCRVLLAAGIAAADMRADRQADREQKQAARRFRVRERIETGGRAEIYRMCRELGYVPTTTQLQRDDRNLAAKLERERETPHVADLLAQVARELNLPIRQSAIGGGGREGNWRTPYRSAHDRAVVYRVPGHLYLHTRLRMDWRELQYVTYPHGIVEVILDATEPRFGSPSGAVRVERILYVRENETDHRLYVIVRADGESFVGSAGRLSFADGPAEFAPIDVRTDVDMHIGEAATYFLGLVNLCHLIESREYVDAVRTTASGDLINRQQWRAAVRAGGRPHYVIVLRPKVTRRAISHELSRKRIETIRAHPRQHLVREHARRYHTRKGVVTKVLRPFKRGGKSGAMRKTYDARPLYAATETSNGKS